MQLVTLDILPDRRRRPGRHSSYVELKSGDLICPPSGPFGPRPLSFGQHSSQEFLYCSRRPAQLICDFVNVRFSLCLVHAPTQEPPSLPWSSNSSWPRVLPVDTSTEALSTNPGGGEFPRATACALRNASPAATGSTWKSIRRSKMSQSWRRQRDMRCNGSSLHLLCVQMPCFQRSTLSSAPNASAKPIRETTEKSDCGSGKKWYYGNISGKLSDFPPAHAFK